MKGMNVSVLGGLQALWGYGRRFEVESYSPNHPPKPLHNEYMPQNNTVIFSGMFLITGLGMFRIMGEGMSYNAVVMFPMHA